MTTKFEELLQEKLRECVDQFNPPLVNGVPEWLWKGKKSLFLSLKSCKWRLKNSVEKSIIQILPWYRNHIVNKALAKIDLEAHAKTFDLLNDEFSQKAFIEVMALRLLGPRKVQMLHAQRSFYDSIEEIDSLKIENSPSISYYWWNFNLFDLHKLGKDYRVYTTRNGVYMDWKSPQYEYFDKVHIQPGDYVIDGGACYGNTALEFAYKAKENGKVYSFEFLKENLDLCQKNFELNPELASRIEIIPHPLWSNSSLELYVINNGPGTHVHSRQPMRYDSKVTSKSIDDLVSQGIIEKIDFLKLDIEGAELECLKGASEAIQHWKPQLAICVYHKDEDLIEIPQYLHQLVPEYKFYMKHHSACSWETVLYATADE